jgi:murein DD-endopeptidase MepM/ murein hydrolase activator NlpD
VTDKQRLARLEECERLLKQTTAGFTPTGQFWKPAMKLLNDVQQDLKPAPKPPLVFPIANPEVQVFTGGLHETDGLPGYWAIDFICHAGLGIVAPEGGTVTKFSGHDPSDDHADTIGAFGWSTYILTAAGYSYYVTHQGRRYPTLRVGMTVQAGDLIGFVGDQRFRPDHAHVAVHSPKGEADAKVRITQVSHAPRVS